MPRHTTNTNYYTRLSPAQVRYQQARSAARLIRRAQLLELSSQDDAALDAELAAYELQRICRNGEVTPDAGRIETFEQIA